MTVKRDKNGRFLKGGTGNPNGRPKDGESWAGIIKAVGDMYPEDIVEFIGKNNDLGRMLAKMPKQVQMKYLVTARVFASLMFEPASGLLNALMDRVDGKVAQPITGDDDNPLKVIIEYADTQSGIAEPTSGTTEDKE